MNILTDLLRDAIARLSPFWVSLVRTYVPVGIGAALGWLTSKGITLPEALTANSEAALIGAGIALWYLAARAFEEMGTKYQLPILVTIGGLMNGIPRAPAYETPVTVYVSDVTGETMARVTLPDGTEQHFIA